MFKKYAAYSSFLLTLACGGGGSSAPNSAPAFTSTSAVTVVENSLSAAQATATDANSQAISFAIAGGADANRFSISATGALSFVSPPNFEAPLDSDGDNVYQVILTASDGLATTSQTLSVTVSNSREGIAVRRLFTGFDQPVAIAAIPGDSRLLVAEKNGSVWFFDPATNSRTLNFRARISIGFTPAPLGPNGIVAMTASRNPFTRQLRIMMLVEDDLQGLQLVIYNLNPPTPGGDQTGGPVLFISRTPNSGPPTGALVSDANGVAYLATGDAGGPSDMFGVSQADVVRLGKLIRITDNADPFAGASIAFFSFSTIAKGLHQPRTLALLGSDILIGDQGQSRFGEINRMPLTASNVNFGWPFREGTASNLPNEVPGLIDPVLQVAFGTGPKQGNALLIGQIFTMTASDLRDKLVFSDATGAIWTVPTSRLASGSTTMAADFERRDQDFAPDLGSISGIVGSVQGNDGRAYIIDSDGEIFEIRSAP